MSVEEDGDKLKLYWDHFFKAETGTYEKSTWLDLFSAEFLIRINEGANPKELIKFCPVSGVVSLVGCELLCGIHRVTSAINAHCTLPAPSLDSVCGVEPARAPPHDASSPSQPVPAGLFTRANAQSSTDILRKYLLSGVAWRCLILLKALGVEGLSCCRQLSSVLIWLCGELGGGAPCGGDARGPGSNPHLPRPAPAAHHIYQLFSERIWSKQKGAGQSKPLAGAAAGPERGVAASRSKRLNHMQAESPERRRAAGSDHSTDTGDSDNDLHLLNRSLTVRLPPSDDFEYFTSLRSADEPVSQTPSLYSDPFYTPRKAKPKADDYLTDRHREILNSEISSFEFTIMITDLLQELCRAESSLSGSEGSQISVQCINFSLRNLCSLQFGSPPSSPHQCTSSERARMKLALTELLIVSLDKVLIRADLCAKLINNGILPMLLRILEDVICKSNGKYHKPDDKHGPVNGNADTGDSDSEYLLKFVFGIAYSITAFFYCLLMQCRSVEKLREFTDQFKLYGECMKGALLKECVELMIRIPTVRGEAVVLIKKLVETVGRLIGGMKRVRSEVIHTAACPRARHRACRARVSSGVHHHHDILGEASAALPLASNCCISVLYGTLTSLVTDELVADNNILRTKILRVMLSCGVCCCFSPGFLMEHMVRLMLTHSAAASLCLQVLEHTVYGELGASVLVPRVTDRLPCSVCEPCEDKVLSFGKTRFYTHGIGSLERKSVWSFLIHYNSLLQLDNHNNVLHATVSHLLRVTPKCRLEMKHELLFSVIYPTFIVSKHRYIIRMEEAAYFLTVSCLNIFSSLLNTVSFAEQFIQKGGLSYVLELVALPEFSKQCCSILEIAIIVEIIKVMKDNATEMSPFRDISSLASVQMLMKSVSDVTDKCYKIYKLKIPDDKFVELIDVSPQRDILLLNIERRDSEQLHPRKVSTSQAVMTTFATSENTTEDCMEDHLEVLKHAATFWKSVAALCLYSPMFREFVSHEAVLLDSYVLLKLLMSELQGGEEGDAGTRVAVKIMEALLTVQFAVSDVTCNRSKEASCSLVRGALAAGAAGSAGGLRALCETLLRVAAAEPSPVHAMPPTSAAKLPPLACVSESASSLERSSSEDSVAPLYASSHSETERADLGYEADVEAGKLELSTSQKSRKLSVSTLTSSSGIGMEREGRGGGASGAACCQYSRSGALQYPELCLIVVDILTHLVHKAVEGDASSSSLARACCGRLCAALSRAPPPRAPLRLLTALLSGPGHALLSNSGHTLQELRCSVLELIETVAGQGIESSELGLFLQLLKAPSPPLASLLGTLARLVAASQPHTPTCLLAFPVQANEKQQVLTGEMASQTGTSQSHQAETFARYLHDQHLAKGIQSAWSSAAVRCGVEGAGWTPWVQGFALTAWLRVGTPAQHVPHAPTQGDTDDEWDLMEDWQEVGEVEARRKCSPPRKPPPGPRDPDPAPQHLFSIGTDALMFEVWLDADTGSLTFKLSRPSADSYKVLSSERTEALPPHRWSCVGLSVREVVRKRLMHVQVTLFVNGCECETVSLPLQGILVRKIVPTNVLVGQCARSPAAAAASAWYMSTVCVFRAPTLDAPGALRRAALHPDVHLVCDTMVERQYPNYALVITPELLDRNIDWDQVYEMSSTKIRELEDNLLFTFSAHSPSVVNLYHQTVALPTVFAGRVHSSAHMLASSAAGLSALPASSIPETLQATWTGAPLPSRHQGLAPALYMLGGPDVLLFMFARVVELEGSAEEQAMALSALLQLCLVDNRLYSMFYCDDSLNMLNTVLSSPKCKFTHHMLKSFLDAVCSTPVLTVSGDIVTVRARGDAAVLEPRPLVLLVRAWREMELECRWETEDGLAARGSLWSLLLHCLAALLHDDHPRRGFNQHQLNRLDLLTHLLLACKERFLNSGLPLSTGGSMYLVMLVRGLVGAPPLLCHLALLTDLLVLCHQASDTFVTHSRANFYFLLTPETQETTENQFLKFMGRRKTTRRAPRSPAARPRTRSDASSRASSEPVSNEPASNESSVRDDHSIDSNHQLKGLAYLQLKEPRKHNISSTSTENSDVAPEEGGVAGSGGAEEGVTRTVEGALTEYIVVDVDDVTHTTVEMCSSGIYHQRRVRAGAEGGWAVCEGLLLLLHDTINVMSDAELTQAVYGAIQAESLVVLGNHRSGMVRAGVVRALTALQRRAPPHLARRTRLHAHLTHLANQISLYPGTWELAAACAALLTKCDVPLEDQLDDDIWLDVTEECISRAPPLLALLPSCVHDVPLAHNLTTLMRRIIDKASLKALSEVALVEVVVRSVRAVGAIPEQHFEGRELLLQDLYELLNRVALKALATHHSMQTINEIHYMLTYIEASSFSEDVDEDAPDLADESEGAGAAAGAGVWRAARDAQCELCMALLTHLDNLLHGEGANVKQTNYFTSVLSSAVSLSGESVSGAVPRSELASRRRNVLTRAVNLTLTRASMGPLSARERALFEAVFTAILTAISGGGSQRGKWWSGSVSLGASATAEWTALLHELCWWSLSGCSAARALEPWVLRALYEASDLVQLHLTPQDPAAQRKLAVYLLRSLQRIHVWSPPPLELAITDWARSWAVTQQGALPERLSGEGLRDEAVRVARADRQRWSRTLHLHPAHIPKVIFRLDAMATKLTESAMWMTRQVVDVQNAERKAFMEHLRRAQAETVACAGRWQRLIDHHTHQQGLWHDPSSYPSAWALDATEGPGRVRVRLRRAHLAIPPRFLKEQHRWKTETSHRASPLRSVVGVARDVHRGLVARLQLNETVTYMARVVYVTVTHDTRGELLLSDRSIHFVPEDSEDELHFDEEGPKTREKYISGSPERLSWTLDQVRGVATRRWCLQERAVELFLSTGHAHLLAFTDTAERNTFLKALATTTDNHNNSEPDSLTESMSAWRCGQLTNWEYLMRLNGLAGRSYNDLMQYPVFPFVLADYSSRILDLRDPAAFRDLSRPMAVQNRKREKHYINTYNDLLAARREGCSALLSRQPHHYASLYSNSGAVLHYLVRVPPFTELFLNYQDNNFDMPDRTFHSLATTWRLITNDSPTDVKELLPELFYLHELFNNTEGLNLGVRQCGAPVDNVELPPWAAHDARLFTLIHRQALESAVVTEQLSHWIDLVFGYKQTGQPAIDAINVFPACTYYGFDPSVLADSLERTAAEAMVRTYGQAPRQLMRVPHPRRQADLDTLHTDQVGVWAGVQGARWGSYCGSPALPPPALVQRRVCAGAAALHGLATSRAVAVAGRGQTIVHLHGGSAMTGATPPGVSDLTLGLLSWTHSDRVVRLKRRREPRVDRVMCVCDSQQVTVVSSSCLVAGCPIFLGHLSGLVLVLRGRAGGGVGSVFRPRALALIAHRAPVTDIHVCTRTSLVVSVSQDGMIVLWDLNKLSYIRTLPNRDMVPVSLATISETLCDVCTVHDLTAPRAAPAPAAALADPPPDLADRSDSYEQDKGNFASLLRVHTVNATFVGSVKVQERVTSVCYSNVPEGVSVNSIATALWSGSVRLYSSWDLRPLTYIPTAGNNVPLLSIRYSSDSSVLFGCYSDGAVVAWESTAQTKTAPIRILSTHSLF